MCTGLAEDGFLVFWFFKIFLVFYGLKIWLVFWFFGFFGFLGLGLGLEARIPQLQQCSQSEGSIALALSENKTSSSRSSSIRNFLIPDLSSCDQRKVQKHVALFFLQDGDIFYTGGG